MGLKSVHVRDVFDRTLFRSGYGNVDIESGTEYLVVCSCGSLQAKTQNRAQIDIVWSRHVRSVEAAERGFDLDGKYFVCRYDRTITDSMDAHDNICTRPKR